MPVLVLLHGGGHSALTWSLVARLLKNHCPVLTFDARGHGDTVSDRDDDLAADTLVNDAAAVVNHFLGKGEQGEQGRRSVVLVGHSMGGAIAVRLAAAKVLTNIVGLVVIDVVEGTALSALPHMQTWLQNRASSFASVEKAIRYVTKAGFVRNIESARRSVPPQVRYSEVQKRYVWRTSLGDSSTYWRGWFEGLSQIFLSVSAAKMLVLANVDRLDKDLMIAQMQGKFQNILIPSAGHTVHEDQPEQTARALLDYLQRNLFLDCEAMDDDVNSTFQQRRPIPPCC